MDTIDIESRLYAKQLSQKKQLSVSVKTDMIFIEIGKYLSLKLTKFHDMKKTALVSNVVHGSCEDFLFLNSISFKFWKSVLFS